MSLDVTESRVYRCALGQGGAFAPALGLLGNDPDEEERAETVHPGGRADGPAEREVDVNELDPGELHDGSPARLAVAGPVVDGSVVGDGGQGRGTPPP